MWGARAAIAAAMAMAAGGSGMAADWGSSSGHEPHWLIDPQTQCYVFYMDRHSADLVTWSGDCPDGKASGNGTATFTDGGRFVESITGPFVHGAAEGVVRISWADGGHFEGTEAAGRFNGPGVLTHGNGDRFDGQWSNNRLNGHGSIVWANGDRYEGELRDSKAEGHGVQTWADGRKYDGLWKDDAPNGHGVLTRKDGSAFEGEFVDGEPQRPVTASAASPASAASDAAKPPASAPPIPKAASVTAPTVVATGSDPASPTPGWLFPLAGAKLGAVDGATIAFSRSAGGLVRETIASGGASQKTYLTFLNSRQGTVSDTPDAAKVTGVFRIADTSVAIDYADGRGELLTPDGAGGVTVTTTTPGQGSFCTAWYPAGHTFTSADREAALAAYASRLGVSTSKHKTAACAVPAADNASSKVDASTHAAGKGTRRHRSDKTALLTDPGTAAPVQAIAIRDSQVHTIDESSPPVVLASASPRSDLSARTLPTAPATPSACLSVETDGGNLGFRNHCGFDVQFAWCVRAGSDASKSCNGGGMAGAVPANGFGPLFAQTDLNTSEYDLRWIACSGVSGQVSPRLVRSDPPAGECVRGRG